MSRPPDPGLLLLL